jgi:hypothetical protein
MYCARRFKAERFKLDRWGLLNDCHNGHSAYLDFDNVRAVRSYIVFSTLRLIGIKPTSLRYERTRHGWHVILTHATKLSAAETVALQCVLGSDRKREALNLMRALAIARGRYPRFWIRRFNILYRGKLP